MGAFHLKKRFWKFWSWGLLLVFRKYVLNSKVPGKSSVSSQMKFVEYILFCYSRTCLLSPEMFPKGDTHKQLFQLMLTMQGREIIIFCTSWYLIIVIRFSLTMVVEFGTKSKWLSQKGQVLLVATIFGWVSLCSIGEKHFQLVLLISSSTGLKLGWNVLKSI